MAFFDWKEEYSVGIQEIDRQHKQLVSLLNKLFEAMKTGEGRNALSGILKDLVAYAGTHFAAEEKLMQANGYPDYPAHKEKHEKMGQRVQAYVEKFNAGELNTPIEISNFLKDWLAKHILQTDKAYGPFLNSKGVV